MAQLRSHAYAQIVDLVSEGPIAGFVDEDIRKSVYFDDVPLRNSDDSDNFEDAVIEPRLGTADQSYIAGFGGVENDIAVAAEATFSTPVVRAVTNPDVDAVRVRISLPALQDGRNGKIEGSSVEFAIDVQPNGGAYSEVRTRKITGQSSGKYEVAERIPLEGSAPWNIRVRRLTADSSDALLQNETWWESYTEIIDAKLRYPFSAVIGVSVDSAQFRGIPRRAYHLRGRIIKVPSNYDPEARTYDGVWDGTFQDAYSNNPAWVFYDLLTRARYGLGRYLPAEQVDKWSLYQIGQYCDAMVPDGFGGTEPRMVCNLYLQSRMEAWRVVDQIASCFRGMIYWGAGSVVPVQDRPADPTLRYTAANVEDGVFTYSGTAKSARHTVALVTWNDPTDLSRQKVMYVPDEAGIARYGIRELQTVAIGASSPGQARRVGRWILASEQTERETVVFRVGLDGLLARPGQIVQIADPARAGVRHGGRLQAATTSTATLDAPVTLASGPAYTLTVVPTQGAPIERTVSTGAGTHATLSVTPDFDEAPPAGAIWILGSDAITPALFRVVSVSEPKAGLFEITALAHNPDKYAVDDADDDIQPPPDNPLYEAPAAVQNLTAEATPYAHGQSTLLQILISWDSSARADRYEVLVRRNADNPQTFEVPTTALELPDALPGVYTVSVIAVGSNGRRSVPTVEQFDFDGEVDPPAEIENLTINEHANGTATLQWDASEEPTVLNGGRIEIRFQAVPSGAAWGAGTLVATVPGNSVQYNVGVLSGGTFMVKPINSANVESAAWTEVVRSTVVDQLPIGTPVPWPFAGAPPGGKYLPMTGGTYAVNDYPELGALYGGTPGGSFTIRDWRGLPAWGVAAGETVGDVVGDNLADLRHIHGAGTLVVPEHLHGAGSLSAQSHLHATPSSTVNVVSGGGAGVDIQSVGAETGFSGALPVSGNTANSDETGVTGDTAEASWGDLEDPHEFDRRPQRALVAWYQRARR